MDFKFKGLPVYELQRKKLTEGHGDLVSQGLVLCLMDECKLLGVIATQEELKNPCPKVARVPFPWRGQDLGALFSGAFDYIVGYDRESGNAVTCLNRQVLFEKLMAEIEYGRRRLECLADTVSDAVCMVDEQQHVILWNGEAEQLYDLPRESILNTPLQQHFSNIMLARVLQQHKDVQASYHQPKAGIHVLINAKAIDAKGKLLGAVSAERNITDIVLLNQELSEASQREKELQHTIQNGGQDPLDQLRGNHPCLLDAVSMVKKACLTLAPITLAGEAGTGKETMAQLIHRASPLRDEPFQVYDFYSRKLPEQGTLFIPELNDLDAKEQQMLVKRIETQRREALNSRVVVATAFKLSELVGKGQLRSDLYYLLKTVYVELPPLRERSADIPELVYAFITEYAAKYSKETPKVASELLVALIQYSWPGNLDELRQVVEQMVIMSEGTELTCADLPPDIFIPAQVISPGQDVDLQTLTEDAERRHILRTLKKCGGNRVQTAKLLGIPRSTLYYKLKSLEIK